MGVQLTLTDQETVPIRAGPQGSRLVSHQESLFCLQLPVPKPVILFALLFDRSPEMMPCLKLITNELEGLASPGEESLPNGGLGLRDSCISGMEEQVWRGRNLGGLRPP